LYRIPFPPFPAIARTMLAAFSAGVCAALLPTPLLAEPSPEAVALPRAYPAAVGNTMRRLIVKYRDDTDASSTVTRFTRPHTPNGKERATALNATGYRSDVGRHVLRLSHLKSISAQSHVMVSDTHLSRAEMTALTRHIAQDPRVEYAEIDERAYPLMVPNDADYAAHQWNLKAPTAQNAGGANLPGAWDLLVAGRPLNGAGVTVAVLDTGYRPHPDLLANIIDGYDFVSMDTDGTFTSANDGNGRDADALDPGDWNPITRIAPDEPCDAADSTWHGIRVAGIIGAVGNNGTGVIGVAYGAKLLPVRVLGRCGGYVSDIATGIQWAAGLPIPNTPTNAHPAKVINVSIGSTGECSSTFQTAINAAHRAGSVIVVATGNQGNKTIDAPANCAGVIAVTAHTRLGDSADYANIGPGTHISAPGGGLGTNIAGDGSSMYSTTNTGLTVPLSDSYAGGYNGTSFSTPHVSGVAALLFQIRPTLSPDAVLSYLQTYARAYPTGTYCDGRSDCGAGMLDAFAAVAALQTAQGTPNRAPVLNALGAQTVATGGSLQFTATATDADGDRVTFTASGIPSGASFDGNAGLFSWGYALPGVYFVSITPSDGVVTGSPSTVRITVTGTLPSGGGGGGGATGLDALAVLLMLGARSVLLRRTRRPPLA
jgi:serine protease